VVSDREESECVGKRGEGEWVLETVKNRANRIESSFTCTATSTAMQQRKGNCRLIVVQ
jgi:hypothetical protein